jgi:hypothetical protein
MLTASAGIERASAALPPDPTGVPFEKARQSGQTAPSTDNLRHAMPGRFFTASAADVAVGGPAGDTALAYLEVSSEKA